LETAVTKTPGTHAAVNWAGSSTQMSWSVFTGTPTGGVLQVGHPPPVPPSVPPPSVPPDPDDDVLDAPPVPELLEDDVVDDELPELPDDEEPEALEALPPVAVVFPLLQPDTAIEGSRIAAASTGTTARDRSRIRGMMARRYLPRRVSTIAQGRYARGARRFQQAGEVRAGIEKHGP
jgi:hypothetical protein